MGAVMRKRTRTVIIDGGEVAETWGEEDEIDGVTDSSAITKTEQLPLKKITDTWPATVGKGTPDTRSGSNVVWYCDKREVEVQLNEFDQRTYVHHDGRWVELTDAVIRAVMVEMHDAGCPSPKGLVSEILHHIGAKNRVHPVREYLDALKWDGKKRLRRLLPHYLKAEDSPLNRAMGKAWMIAAVRRVREPGVKFDYILTLQGEQGSGKSTFFRVLAGDDWFNDSLEIGVSAKEVIENASGSWIIELAELSSMSRREVEEVKKFASIQADRARTAWARVAEMVRRQFVFGATVNRAEFLIDDTGNRRFWVAAVGRTREAELRADRDQLWAEAAHCEAQGESHNIRDELWEEVAVVNEKHMVHDSVAEAAERILSALPDEDAAVPAHELAHACGIEDVTRQGGVVARSIAAGARRAGWTADRGRLPGPRTAGSVRYFHSRRTSGQLAVYECAPGSGKLTKAESRASVLAAGFSARLGADARWWRQLWYRLRRSDEYRLHISIEFVLKTTATICHHLETSRKWRLLWWRFPSRPPATCHHPPPIAAAPRVLTLLGQIGSSLRRTLYRLRDSPATDSESTKRQC